MKNIRNHNYRSYKLNLNNNIKYFLLFILFSFGLLDLYFDDKRNKNNIMYSTKIPVRFNISEKDFILKMISNSIGRAITSIKSIFCSEEIFFGNQIITLNNII